jgi:hypothetical protein
MIPTARIEDVFARYGMPSRRHGCELVGPCPKCGGTDRRSVNIKKQLFNCRGCTVGGDVYDMVMHYDDVGFREARRIVDGDDHTSRPIIKPAPPVEKVADNENFDKAMRIWKETVEGDPLVDAYFASRKLSTPTSPDVRFHANCPFDGNSRRPCVVALFRNIHTNQPQAIHRTALNPNGTKFGRLTLGPWKGSVIKLSPDADVGQGLVIGEGVETCLSGVMLGFRPVWATGSAPGIRSFPVLAGVDCLTILVDADEADRNGRRAGQDSALECSARWTSDGREVFRIVPRLLGSDMADVWEAES